MSTGNEFRSFNEAADKIQRELDQQRKEQNSEVEKMTAELFKILEAQQEEDPVMKTITEVLERAEAFGGKRMHITIMTKEIKALEEANPEFAEVTKTGFSEEEAKRYIVSVFDALFEVLNIGKLENTLSNVLLSIKRGSKIEFSKFNGTSVYNYAKSKDIFDKYLTPEFKKKIIYGRAVQIVVEAKTISFNTAVKRAIREIKEEGFILKMDADDQEFLDDISGIINPLIDLYIDNEMQILAAIVK